MGRQDRDLELLGESSPEVTVDPSEEFKGWEGMAELTRDIRKASELLDARQARYLVDIYYQIQHIRIASNEQVRSSKKDGGEPHQVLEWLHSSMHTLEKNVASSLGRFVNSYIVGRWMRSICGVGPVIAAGFLAHLDIRKAPHAGHFHSFAGLHPNIKWEKGQKRPYNAKLKTLVSFKLGESFVKQQSRDTDVYGHMYVDKKMLEIARNQKGDLADQAEDRGEKVGSTTMAYKWYNGFYKPDVWDELLELPMSERAAHMKAHEVGKGKGVRMLPPLHIHRRACRWVGKLFLSHLHAVMFEDYHGKSAPDPFPFSEHCPEAHKHFIPPPNWPMKEVGKTWKSLTDLLVEPLPNLHEEAAEKTKRKADDNDEVAESKPKKKGKKKAKKKSKKKDE